MWLATLPHLPGDPMLRAVTLRLANTVRKVATHGGLQAPLEPSWPAESFSGSWDRGPGRSMVLTCRVEAAFPGDEDAHGLARLLLGASAESPSLSEVLIYWWSESRCDLPDCAPAARSALGSQGGGRECAGRGLPGRGFRSRVGGKGRRSELAGSWRRRTWQPAVRKSLITEGLGLHLG